MNKVHLVIPDTQIRPEDDLDFVSCIGQYIVHKKPDVVVMLGDWADMHSLSSYDAGRLSGEGARYVDDIAVANEAIDVLMSPIPKMRNLVLLGLATFAVGFSSQYYLAIALLCGIIYTILTAPRLR